MAWFRRAKRADDDGPAEPEPPPPTDTAGNPIIERVRREAEAGRHAAPDVGPTRAERRMLEFVVGGRVTRTTTGGAASAFWRIDNAFATGTKAMMLDWLLDEDYIELGARARVSAAAQLTDRGRAVLESGT